MKNLYEALPIGKGGFLCYPEDHDVHRELRRFNPQLAQYESSGRVVGWHHVVKRSAFVFLDRKFDLLKNKGLTSVVSEDLTCGGGPVARNSPDQDPVTSMPISENQIPIALHAQDAVQAAHMPEPLPVGSYLDMSDKSEFRPTSWRGE